jgi:hypothetical protein
MKYFIKFQTVLVLVSILFFVSCAKEGKYLLTETPPLDFKSYYNGLEVTFVNATNGATNISWDFGDQTASVSGDSLVHTFATIGNYVITMKATYKGKEYTFHTVLRVDKPSHIKLDDNSFADWNLVTYPDFQLAGKAGMQKGKVDYDANNIYFFIEYVAPANADLNNGIMDIFMDVDNSSATGLTLKGLGCDYLLEGNIVNWFDPYIFAGATQSDWNFANYSTTNYYQLGYTESSGDTVRMEFSVSREAFKITGDAFQFALTMMDSNWAEIGTLSTLPPDLNDKIVVKMDKQ